MICLAGPIMFEGNPIKRRGSGNRINITVAIKVPFKEAKPPIITIDRTGMSCISVKELGSIYVI